MKTWVRLHTALLTNRKVQSLPPILFKFWVNCLAFAGREDDGTLPPLPDMAWELHEPGSRIDRWVSELVKARLLDVEDGGADDITFYRPHNWRQRQFDISPATERTRRFRERHKNVPGTFQERSDERSDERSSRASVLSESVLASSVSGFKKETFLAENSIFPDWWEIWSKVRGTHHSADALTAWQRFVPIELESSALECTVSYLASLENPAKGYNPDRFLEAQAKEQFQSRWPAFTAARKENGAERVITLMKKRIADGRSPL